MQNAKKDLSQWLNRLTDKKLTVRLEAAYTLAKQGNFEGKTVFLTALKDDEADIRIQASWMLGQIGANWAVDPLGALIEDEDTEVRNEAIFALLETCRLTAVLWLIKALQDSDEERREDARVALAALLGDKVAYYTDFTLSGEEEMKQVSNWWQVESSQYNPQLCYAWGKPVSLGEWITRLRTESEPVVEWLAKRLHFWTGVTFGTSSSPKLASQWESWWQKNASSFQIGLRYFYGYLVD